MGEVRLNNGKSGKMAPQTRAGLPNQAIDCCGESSVPSTVARWYNFPEFGGYLGNVGQERLELMHIKPNDQKSR
jgi:hypothetical protein